MNTMQNQNALVSKHGQPAWLIHHRGLSIALGVLIAFIAGLASAYAMPHGPATTAQALLGMAAGFALGFTAGWLMRSRWGMLIVPIAHALAIELIRQNRVEPSAGAIRLDSIFGILGLVTGRGVYGLLVLVPMIVGAGIGAALSLRSIKPPSRLAKGGMAAAGVGLVALAVLVAWPAQPPPIVDASGNTVPGSIATLEPVSLGGAEQWITIRAHNPDKPVLLYLSGGPGQSDLPFPRVMFEDLSRDFVLVCWDQRGTGKSYAAIDPISSLTLEQAVNDTIELTNYLRERFDEDKIYMLGESWGSTLGVLAVQRRPDLYHAWIGSGQMVSQRETDRRLYRDVLALAQQSGDAELDATMRAYGEPPYADIPYAYAFVMGLYDRLYKPYEPPASYIARGSSANIGFFGVMGSEYAFIDKINVIRGLMDMFTLMYPQIQHIDFRQDVPKLEVPVYLLDGKAELTSRRDLAVEWFEKLEAPAKRMFSFDNAAHAVAFEQYEAFHKIMLDTVLPETYAAQK
jgi:pimeloyl-ACP methyl ester carboxylesterase